MMLAGPAAPPGSQICNPQDHSLCHPPWPLATSIKTSTKTQHVRLSNIITQPLNRGGSTPPPCRSPPLVVPRGGGGASLGQPKIFRCGSLCCCVGDCVVGHYHLHPLHSWQDILLTFAEMELDSTTMFPPWTSVMFIRSMGEICLRLPSLLPRRQNHHPTVLPTAFQWKVVSMCKSSR